MTDTTLRDRFTDYRGRRKQRKKLRASTKERYRFRLRRFAGAEEYVGQFDEPLRVAHLTDLHVGLVTPHKVQLEAVAITNREKPDIVVITGDFVCHSTAYLHQLTDVVSRIEAPVFGVLGNHDYWAGAAEVRKALVKGGVELLSNVNTVVELGHRRLQLVGLDDAYTGHADRERAIRGMRKDLPTLGLSHIAEEADGLWAAGVPLVLSGHTHGGQLSVARLNELTVRRLFKHRYVHGLYGVRSAQDPLGAVYVGAGVGAAVMPIRLGDRGGREVTLFDLGVDPNTLDEHHDEQDVFPIADDHCEITARRVAQERFKQRCAKKKKAS